MRGETSGEGLLFSMYLVTLHAHILVFRPRLEEAVVGAVDVVCPFLGLFEPGAAVEMRARIAAVLLRVRP